MEDIDGMFEDDELFTQWCDDNFQETRKILLNL
jgi:hypothetical protein